MNHKRQAELYSQFCQKHRFKELQPSVKTVCMYITYLSRHFTSANSIRNYVSGVRFFHKQLGLECSALDSFQVVCLLRAVDTALRRPPHRMLPITPDLLSKIISTAYKLGSLATVFRVAVLFAYYGFLRVSNVAPPSAALFDSSRHTCRGDVLLRRPGIVIVLKWTKTIQDLGATPLIPLAAIPGHHLDPVAPYKLLLQQSPTTSANQPLLTQMVNGRCMILTSVLLNKLLRRVLRHLGMEQSLYSFHSLRRGGATTACHAGVKISEVKRHGTWASDSFWTYLTSASVEQSPVAHALSSAVKAST
jgi:hypothetical protein